MQTAAEQGRAIAAGRLCPVAQTEAYLEAADTERVYARLTRARALAEAMAARERARLGLRLGPLDGICMSWKDNFDSAGVATEAGSKLLAGRTPLLDAQALAQASAGGTICLGKTHMTELAFSGLGLNPITASPPNAIEPHRASGGSSSGAAVSVKLGMAAAALGTDTGGSVRIPSAWNDLVGFKPAHGRLPDAGVVPLCPRFDTVGPLAQSVEDASLLWSLLRGEKPLDLRAASLQGARFLVLDGYAFEGARAEPLAGFAQAVECLAQAGARIDHAVLPMLAPAMALSGVLFAPEAYGTWAAEIEAQPELMYPLILERFRGGATVRAADYVKAWQELSAYRQALYAACAGYDALLVPTAPILPPDAARLLAEPEYFAAENLLALRNTRIGNVFNLATITLPTGVPMTGLSLMALPMAENRLLRLAHAAEGVLRN